MGLGQTKRSSAAGVCGVNIGATNWRTQTVLSLLHHLLVFLSFLFFFFLLEKFGVCCSYSRILSVSSAPPLLSAFCFIVGPFIGYSVVCCPRIVTLAKMAVGKEELLCRVRSSLFLYFPFARRPRCCTRITSIEASFGKIGSKKARPAR